MSINTLKVIVLMKRLLMLLSRRLCSVIMHILTKKIKSLQTCNIDLALMPPARPLLPTPYRLVP